MKTIINGIHCQAVSANDRGLQYGDGHFTTAKVTDGKIEFLDAHLARLQKANQILQFPAISLQQLTTQMASAAQQLGDGVLKVIITRGEGGRGYAPPPSPHLTCIISTHPKPAYYDELHQRGLVLKNATFKLGLQPALAGIKHLNRLEQVLIKQELAQTSADDLVVSDINENVVETSQGNLFWCCDGQWFTPELRLAGVEGVMRNRFIHQLSKIGHKVRECSVDSEALLDAQHLLVTNSVIGVIWASRFNDKLFAKPELKWN